MLLIFTDGRDFDVIESRVLVASHSEYPLGSIHHTYISYFYLISRCIPTNILFYLSGYAVYWCIVVHHGLFLHA